MQVSALVGLSDALGLFKKSWPLSRPGGALFHGGPAGV
jgi:hypothetical protein